MKRRTFRFTYRSTCGIDVETVQELKKGETVADATLKCIEDHRHSVTPLVRVHGHKKDITNFLEAEKKAWEDESERCKMMAERLGREIKRRQKEPDHIQVPS